MTKEECFWSGTIVGVFVAMIFAIAIAELAVKTKIDVGFLTHQNKTYTVKLYDTLDKPEKETK